MMMRATFRFPGTSGDSSYVNVIPEDFPVTLATNGMVVKLEPSDSSFGVPAFTPEGWHRLASAATTFMDEANKALKNAGGE